MSNNQNAVKALLAEYKKTIIELQSLIETITDANLRKIVDPKTNNTDSQSIQTILSHVVGSGFSYNVYIQNHRNENAIRPAKVLLPTALSYIQALDGLIKYTEHTFADVLDNELEEFEETKKIHTRWHQSYDIEQLMEHAIVHILRHRRQIEHFNLKLNNGLGSE